VENAIVILALFRIEQINAVDATHTEAYQRNILSKFLERMRESMLIGYLFLDLAVREREYIHLERNEYVNCENMTSLPPANFSKL